ncbi:MULTISPECIES: non-hydrolyzing UDP-N-acetylglucosamine 2-epimerase [unclassified Imperialibacter]|uniref:non-hydrolyzing UDP-N-acetylglucosamine 2-epimerase n=1 Tax=unclassified Imperialibacter TaxID=2629706 RepID=UPI00125387AA|nr:MULTISPECIES: UDP-N-acetylglucosamine 2-epimerase (non-hydrolyzing) [unclassified Imperialibacter]CAD5299226.1 UDP-N-acetylglucosamine 2-epimerase [Imperialibacter sp. 89]CAD5299801.1 UDP-N-acetylglucosamine 2-epimerase [Imperialibacter sp. 75]VVT20771.1 UDP-N-acetylglucosamine 2-epimerase [Imperialibacter sp. EC-SDR9]
MRLVLVAGARPNFMKIAPLIKAIKKFQAERKELSFQLVHTGQHYDYAMSKSFFDQLEIPEPDANLNVGSGTQAAQTGKIMMAFEEYLTFHPCDLVIVVGDVTSTMACTIVAKKMMIKLAHVEAGLRSYDMAMPEEINRIVTDSLADYLFTTTEWASANLVKMGVPKENIFFVGNTMIDNLIQNLDKLQSPEVWNRESLSAKNYYLLTLHRPSNVDDPNNLVDILSFLSKNLKDRKIIFPVHPRTRTKLQQAGFPEGAIVYEPPFAYFEFMFLVKNAIGVITDSGGIQEETTYLKVPCITLRENTERPETIDVGTNELVGSDRKKLIECIEKIESGKSKKGAIPELWDGKAAERIITKILLLN